MHQYVVHVPAGLDMTTLSATPQLEVRQISLERSQCEKEPLFQMTALEHKTWTDAIHAATAYRPKEAAQHSQRLQAYVEAAVGRAAGQLQPGLRKELYEALGLAPS
jgi:hypothetical protein